jgi:hypothetical protein
MVVLSFRLLFQQLQFWFRTNIRMALLSIPILTGPGAKAALYQQGNAIRPWPTPTFAKR